MDHRSEARQRDHRGCVCRGSCLALNLLINVDVLRIVEQQTDRHIRRVDLRAEDVLRRIMRDSRDDSPIGHRVTTSPRADRRSSSSDTVANEGDRISVVHL